MATLTNGIQFTGSIGDITGYTRKGSDKNYIRSKGGISRQRILTAPEFELCRQNSSEFRGCGKAASSIRKAIFPVAHLTAPNFNIISKATIIIKAIQKLDVDGDRGKRAIRFSQYKHILEGFNLNPMQSIDGIILPPLHCTIDRETGVATVLLPALHPGINLLLPWSYPMYRFIAHLGALSDMAHEETGYSSTAAHRLPYALPAYTAWQYTRQPYAGETISIQLQHLENLDTSTTLLLSVGLEMGTPVTDTLVTPEKKKGCAKILKVG
jgi:hypothetical protein